MTVKFLDENVGRLFVALDFGLGLSPAIEAAVEPGSDPQELAERLAKEIDAAVTRVLGDRVSWGIREDPGWAEKNPLVSVHPRTGPILPREERDRLTEERLAPLRAVFQAGDALRAAAAEEDPNNGTLGWWRVDGIRHSALVRCSSAPEAIRKAAGDVGDWEGPEAKFIGVELPDVVSI